MIRNSKGIKFKLRLKVSTLTIFGLTTELHFFRSLKTAVCGYVWSKIQRKVVQEVYVFMGKMESLLVVEHEWLMVELYGVRLSYSN